MKKRPKCLKNSECVLNARNYEKIKKIIKMRTDPIVSTEYTKYISMYKLQFVYIIYTIHRRMLTRGVSYAGQIGLGNPRKSKISKIMQKKYYHRNINILECVRSISEN